MTRNLQAATNSAASADEVRYRLLVEIDSTSTGTTRACNGMSFIQFAGNTYAPIGTLGGVDKVQETSDMFPRALRLWFAAVSSAQIADVLGESLFNCPVKLRRGFLNEQLTLVASAELLFKGYVETCDLKLKDPKRGNHFVIEAESRLAQPPIAQYFNKETLQQVLGSSGDTFFDYTYMIPFTRASWGQALAVGYQDPLPPGLRDPRGGNLR